MLIKQYYKVQCCAGLKYDVQKIISGLFVNVQSKQKVIKKNREIISVQECMPSMRQPIDAKSQFLFYKVIPFSFYDYSLGFST